LLFEVSCQEVRGSWRVQVAPGELFCAPSTTHSRQQVRDNLTHARGALRWMGISTTSTSR
jgi:hypothetical protein